MIHIAHLPSLIRKPLEDQHGEDTLYQIFFEDYPEFGAVRPDSMKAFTSFSRVLIKPGTTNQMHVHDDQEQVYFVIQGEGVIQIGEEKADVKAGDSIFLPSKVPHGFVNNSEKLVILLMIGAKI